MSEMDVYALFQGSFKEIYADLIAVLGTKPSQVVFEIEAAFTHVAVAKTQPAIANENYKKALDHVRRAALDAAKMLWIAYKHRLDKYLNDDALRNFCCNASEVHFIQTYEKAEELAQQARKEETKNVGVNPEAAIEKYYEAARLFKNCLGMIDSFKEKKFHKFRRVCKFKELAISFCLGILTSSIVTYAFFYVPNPKVPAQSAKQATPPLPQLPANPIAVATKSAKEDKIGRMNNSDKTDARKPNESN